MKALVFKKFQGELSVQQVPTPSPKPFGVVVKIAATGLCRSDWHGWMGHDADITLPHVPGHEFAGSVVAVGKEVNNFEVGDRVTVPFVSGCGTCPQCHSGNHQICNQQSQPGFTHWGSFAKYVALDYADVNLVKLPDSIDYKTAATLGCRFITAFRAVVDQGKVSGGQFVAVHGCGGVGLSAIMIAQALGAQVIAVDINDNALKLAKKLGAVATINASPQEDVISEVQEFSKGGVHVSLDALGSATTCFNSVANLRKRGKHIQLGLMTGEHAHAKIPMDKVIAHELEILGSHGMQAFRYPELLEMILNGKLKPKKLIEKKISLKEAATLLPKMNEFEHHGVIMITSI